MALSNLTQRRLNAEIIDLQKNPVPFIEAKPDPSNMLIFYYVIKGPPDTPYHGGVYLGKLLFPSNFPSKPPRIEMSTPSGRFSPNTRLCLSISDYHPELWNPAWRVSTILNGLLSFMTGNEHTTGSIRSSDSEKRTFAAQSHTFNKQNSIFTSLFPHLVK